MAANELPAQGSLHTYINPDVAKGTTIALTIIATGVGITRTIIRFQRFGRFYTDDAFLLIAVLSCIAGTGVLIGGLDDMYTLARVEGMTVKITPQFPEIYARANLYTDTCVALFWITVFAVKYAFLFFFYRLIDRMQNLKRWWWFCTIIIVPMAVANIINAYITCDNYKPTGITDCAKPGKLTESIATLEYSFTFDIVSDFLVISIPILLLRKSRSLHLRQKIILGAMLCLSIFLILIAIFRFSSTQVKVSGVWAFIWYIYWSDVQACIAIMLCSATAFRTLFVTDNGTRRTTPRMNNILKSWRTGSKNSSGGASGGSAGSQRSLGASLKRLLGFGSNRSRSNQGPSNGENRDQDVEKQLPNIPHVVTMTGMRSMIRDNGVTQPGSFGGGEQGAGRSRTDGDVMTSAGRLSPVQDHSLPAHDESPTRVPTEKKSHKSFV